MDKGLSRLDQSRRDKLPVVIPKGRIRPVSPLTAARFATECNNAIKNHVPVHLHWSKYKEIGRASWRERVSSCV